MRAEQARRQIALNLIMFFIFFTVYLFDLCVYISFPKFLFSGFIHGN